MKDWQKELGEKSIKELAEKGILNNPEQQKELLGKPIEGWLFFTLMNRLAGGKNE